MNTDIRIATELSTVGRLDSRSNNGSRRFYIPWWALSALKAGKTAPEMRAVLPPLPAIVQPSRGAGAIPQLENGYTRIANEIMEALADKETTGRLASYSFHIIIAVIRKTYGYQKKVDWISNSQLTEMTGIGKQNVSRTMKELCDRRILLRSGKKVGLNKNYHEWVKILKGGKLSNQITPTPTDRKGELSAEITKVISLGDKSYLIEEPQKKKKENIGVSPEGGSTLPVVKTETTESVSNLLPLEGTDPLDFKRTLLQKQILDTSETFAGPMESEAARQVPGNGRRPLRKLRTPKKPTDPRVSEAITYFSDACQELKGFKPAIAGGKDGQNVKEALKTMELAEIKGAIHFFLKSPKSKEVGVSLSAALSAHTVNMYRAGKKQGDPGLGNLNARRDPGL